MTVNYFPLSLMGMSMYVFKRDFLQKGGMYESVQHLEKRPVNGWSSHFKYKHFYFLS